MGQLTLPLRCRTPTSPETGVRLRPTRAQGERPRTDIFPALSRGLIFFFGRGGAESGPCRASEGLSTGRPMGCPYSPRREAVANRHALQRPCLQAWAETWCDVPLHRARVGVGKVGGLRPSDRLLPCTVAYLATDRDGRGSRTAAAGSHYRLLSGGTRPETAAGGDGAGYA